MQRSADTSSSSHELPMEPREKVDPGSGKHSVYTHGKNNVGVLQKTCWYSRAESGTFW